MWMIFPYIGNNNPNWQTHIFQRGRLKPPTSLNIGNINEHLLGGLEHEWIICPFSWEWNNHPN